MLFDSKRFSTEEEIKTGDEKWRLRRQKRKKKKKRYIKGRKKMKTREKIAQCKPKAPNRKTTKQNIEK